MVKPTSRDRDTGEVFPGVLEKTEIDVPELKAGEVLVEVAGCGICDTDLGYFYDGVPTVNKLMLWMTPGLTSISLTAS